MQHATRPIVYLLVSLVICMSALVLPGCGGSSAASEQATDSASSAAADENSGEEQDNCYGDDMPAKKS